MCEYLKRMSPQDAPTDDIRRWSGLAHSVVEYTGPRPFGMDGSACLWLHERSVTQLLDMCDELDAKFSDLVSENAKLRELVRDMWAVLSYSTECRLICKHGRECYRENECVFEKCTRELGIEVE